MDSPDDPQKAQVDKLIEQLNLRLTERNGRADENEPQPMNAECDGHAPDGQQRESAYDRNLKKLTDEQLAKQALELRAKVDAHMREMARRLGGESRPNK